MSPVTISDTITVGDIAILDKDRWPAECDRNGTIIAIVNKKDDDSTDDSTRWFNSNFKQHLSIESADVEDYLLVIMPHSQKYQLEGYDKEFSYSETTFLNRRCIVALSDFIQQISPSGLYNKDRITAAIMREASLLPTRRERN